MTALWLDADPTHLRARGSLKWTATPASVAAWVAESDLGTAPAVSEALHGAIDRGLTGYLPRDLAAETREACAAWQRERYGWDVPVSRVHLVPDVIEAFRIAVHHHTRAGGAVVLPTPAYMPFVTLPEQWDRSVVRVPMVGDADGQATFDLVGIEEALSAHPGSLLALVNPHNPTGRVHERAELIALAEVVQRTGAWVFADEIHAPLVGRGRTHVPYASLSPATAAHTTTATAASKGWNIPGLKCAQVIVTDEDDAAWWEANGEQNGHGVSTLGAVATTAAYRHGGPWLEGLLDYVAENSTALREALGPQIPFADPEGTYLVWLDLRGPLAALPSPPPPGEVARWLLETAGVAVVDGMANGGHHGFVRFNLATPRPLVVEAGRRLRSALGC
ncbi:MalY/PatB family protein [Actinotalea sp.]|uniref:MalY/PatB family protein n=1 Tax=Actinotalea sp. TaxID=1872145 RepID=UPI00356A9A2C